MCQNPPLAVDVGPVDGKNITVVELEQRGLAEPDVLHHYMKILTPANLLPDERTPNILLRDYPPSII
jgi:hypothetical protein